MVKTRETNCYNCGSQDHEHYDRENGFNLVKCKTCGLLYVNPRPSDDEITSATKTGLHRGKKTIDLTGSFDNLKVKRYLSILNDFYGNDMPALSGSSWLDIGCGHGEFLRALEIYFEKRFRVSGIEPNTAKIKSAQKRGLDARFFDIESCTDKYDFISLLNIYSHLPNPIDGINKWKRLLKPGGELFLETGHSSHLENNDHHKPYYLPDHLSFADKKIVVNILERTGFRIIEVKLYRPATFPELRPLPVIRELARIVLGRGGRIGNFFPKYPLRDMFIRARIEPYP